MRLKIGDKVSVAISLEDVRDPLHSTLIVDERNLSFVNDYLGPNTLAYSTRGFIGLTFNKIDT